MKAPLPPVSPETALFKDDGIFPNSRLPVLIYRQAFVTDSPDAASVMESCFAANGWTGAWRDGVYPFRHCHSTTHEVLGVFRGSATLELGGSSGGKFQVKAGDVIVIPAGVAHRCPGGSEDFRVVGAYPEGRSWDVLRGEPGERPSADKNIAAVPLPERDPVHGSKGLLRNLWSAQD